MKGIIKKKFCHNIVFFSSFAEVSEISFIFLFYILTHSFASKYYPSQSKYLYTIKLNRYSSSNTIRPIHFYYSKLYLIYSNKFLVSILNLYIYIYIHVISRGYSR